MWKVRLLAIGAPLGIWGMAEDNSWIIGAGGAILLAGFFLRFLPGASSDPTEEPEINPGESGREFESIDPDGANDP